MSVRLGPVRGASGVSERRLGMPEAWWREWRRLTPTGRLMAAGAPVEEFVRKMRRRGLSDSRIREILRRAW